MSSMNNTTLVKILILSIVKEIQELKTIYMCMCVRERDREEKNMSVYPGEISAKVFC